MALTVECSGKVWLAGAGPGDAGLLTVKTRHLMETADVIVYDALVSPEILSQIPDHCRMIYVGKRSGNHTVPQSEINQILLDEARAGNRVLRLKGGDPFVFGRGGEELELLVQSGIPFEVVPGITSASAVPAYAGIPVTHRDFTSSFHVITGHPRKGGENRIDYAALVSLNATLVFLMGVSAVEEICRELIKAGMDADTPAAILEKGTTSDQRTVVSAVSRLAEAARQAGAKAPSIIVIGHVCGLADLFAWAEKRILGGRQILITRPRAVSSGLAVRLRDLGAQVIELPSIATRPVADNKQLSSALTALAAWQKEAWLVFTSAVGVRVFFQELKQRKLDLRSFLRCGADLKFAAIGPATARELEHFGLIADLVPETYCAANLGKALAKRAGSDSRILILRAREGSEELLPPLEEKGLAAEDIAIYETVYEVHEQIQEKIGELYDNDGIDAVVFTSASTVHGFAKTIKKQDYSKVPAVCIGSQTAAAAQQYGMTVMISQTATIDSLTEKLIEVFGK